MARQHFSSSSAVTFLVISARSHAPACASESARVARSSDTCMGNGIGCGAIVNAAGLATVRVAVLGSLACSPQSKRSCGTTRTRSKTNDDLGRCVKSRFVDPEFVDVLRARCGLAVSEAMGWVL